MIETPTAAERAHEIALETDFLSIGTNDLVQYTLGLDREQPVASGHPRPDARGSGWVAQVVDAAHAAGKDRGGLRRSRRRGGGRGRCWSVSAWTN